MKKTRILIILISVLTITFSAAAFAPPEGAAPGKIAIAAEPARGSSEKLEAIAESDELLANASHVIFSEDGTRLSSLSGNFLADQRNTNEETVRSFLLENGGLFNILRNSANLHFVEETTGGNGRHFRYHMQVADLPVEDSEILVHLGNTDQIRQIDGSFPEVDEVNMNAAITSEEAEKLAEGFLKIESRRAKSRLEKFIRVENRIGKVFYRVLTPAEKPLGDWEVIIDAETGEEKGRKNLLVFYEGKGSTYVSHPLKCDVTVEPLPDLVDGTLRGKFADIHNDETSNAISSAGEFIHPTHNLHFNEAMMYYLVNRVHAFYSAMGFARLDLPLKAVVRYKVLYDNAFFSVLENAMYFGDGYKFNDLAREESVCFHEYAHAARNQIVKLKYEGESGAIDEGQADYFAASLSEDPVVGEFVVNKMGKPWLRNLTDSNRYPENITGNVHEDGKIWGCTLWDLRQALGRKICDQLVLNSLYYLSPDSTFQHGLNAILVADENTFAGSNKDTIVSVFGRRGISIESGSRFALLNADLKQLRRFKLLQDSPEKSADSMRH